MGSRRAGAWLAERFREVGLDDVRIDDVGNVFGVHPGFGQRYVALSAHIDTVFPANTPLNIRQQGSRLYGPGVSDNGAGVAAMLGIASLLRAVRLRHALPFVFIGNVGEEGEGDLRGMRHIFSTPRWKDSIAYSVVLDGAGADTIVAEALGSRRFEVIVRGPGGHSWSDFGAPNPIVILSRAVDTFTATPVPTAPKTTFNIGVIRGGTSVNSIPESASMKVDIRSTSMAEMERLEQALRLALNRAVEDETMSAEMRSAVQKRPSGVNCEVVAIGNRPAGELAAGARILHVIRAVDAQLNNAAQVQRASTDANIPLSLGLEADCHRRRRFGRRGAYLAGMVRQQWTRAGAEADSADDDGAGGSGGGGMTRRPETSGANALCKCARFFTSLKRCAAQTLHAVVESHFSQRTREMGHPAFLVVFIAIVCGAQAPAPTSAPEKTDTRPRADAIYLHANVYTGVPSNSPFSSIQREEAMAVRGDRIQAVGKTADVLKLKGPETQVIDLGGHFVMPGFNDAHLHLADAGMQRLSVDLTGVKTLDEFRERGSRPGWRRPSPTNGFWAEDGTRPSGQYRLCQAAGIIDQVSDGHPVFLDRVDGHLALANTRALQLASITVASRDPEGGKIDRDANGQPTGILRETAKQAVRAAIPQLTRDERRRAIEVGTRGPGRARRDLGAGLFAGI